MNFAEPKERITGAKTVAVKKEINRQYEEMGYSGLDEKHNEGPLLPGFRNVGKYRVEERWVDVWTKHPYKPWEYRYSYKRQVKNQWFKCIGGPFDGHKRTYTPEERKGYSLYNSSIRGDPSVMIWDPLLES